MISILLLNQAHTLIIPMTQTKHSKIYSFMHSKDFKKSPVESAIPLDTRGLLTWVYPTGTRAWYIRPEYVEAHGVAKA